MVLKKSDVIGQMNLPQFVRDPGHQYNVLKHVRKMGDFTVTPLDPEYREILNEAVVRIAALGSVSQLQQLFKDGNEALHEFLKNAAADPIKFVVADEDKIYLEAPPGTFLREFVEYARYGNAPLAFYFWAGVALLSASCRRKFAFPGTATIYMNMYIILGAARAAGKGQALRGLMEILDRVNIKVENAYHDLLPRDPQRAYQLLDQIITHIPTDCTQEAIVQLLDERQRPVPEGTKITRVVRHDATGLIAADELATLLGKDTYNSTKKSAFLVEIKEASRYNKRTKKSGKEYLFNTGITMIACCAPDWLGNSISRDMLTGGFTDRICWIYRTPNWPMQERVSITKGSPKNPLKANELADWLLDHVLCVEDLEYVAPTQAATDRLDTIWQDMVQVSRTNFSDLGLDDSNSSASRLYQQVVQLASLLAISEIPDNRPLFQPIVLEDRHVDLAHRIIVRENESMVTFLSEASRHEQVGQMREFLAGLRKRGGCASRAPFHKDMQRLVAFPSRESVRNTAMALAEDGEIIRCKTTTGRPMEIYKLPEHGTCERCEGTREL